MIAKEVYIQNIDWEPPGRLDNVSSKIIAMAITLQKMLGKNISVIDNGDTFTVQGLPLCKESNPLYIGTMTKFNVNKANKIGACNSKFKNNCSLKQCPYIVYIYLVYILHNDIDYLKSVMDRVEDHISKEKIDDIISNEYSFELDDMYLDLTEEQVNIGYAISSRGLINVRNNMKRNTLVIDTYETICDVHDIKNLKGYVDNHNIFGRPKTYNLDLDRCMNRCDRISRNCNNQDCIIRISAYIDYLITTGRFKNWLNKWNEHNNKKFTLKEYTKNNLEDSKALNNVIRAINRQDSKAISCIVQGNNGSGRYDIINYINHELLANNKVITSIYKHMSLNQFVKSVGKTYSFKENEVNKSEFGQLFSDTLYVVDNISRFFRNRCNIKSEDYLQLIDLVSDVRDNTHIIFVGNEYEINLLMSITALKGLYGNNIIKLKDITAEMSYSIFSNAINQELNKKLNPEFKEEYIKFIALSNNKIKYKNKKLAEYLANRCNIVNKLEIPEEFNTYSTNKTLDELLSNIIGMNSIKHKLKEFEKYMVFKKEAESLGYQLPQSNIHMIFTGNPGTGKTTIARLVAHILYEIGIIKENKLIEVEKKDLEGSYVGQTAPKTASVIEKAMGGVLFIDEAYSLTSGIDETGKGYGLEVIATLIKAMEDKKGEFVVIFAGYKKEMGTFINSNPGIASRIGYTFNFEDYTVEELMDIFKMKVTSSKFEITKEAEDKVLELIRYFHGTENLGNGRFIDKILQHTLQKHACTFNKENINILSEEDVPSINEVIDTMATDDNYRAINLENSTLDEIAYHEIGHFIVGVALGLKSKPIEITINATNSGSLGHVKWDISESSTHKKQDLEYQITECLAGLASEKLKYNEFGTGGSSDLKQATYIAKVMISKLGMSEQGMAYRDMSEIDYTEVNKILDKQMQLASDILKQHEDIIEKMYGDLIANKRIDKEQLEAYVNMIKASKDSK